MLTPGGSDSGCNCPDRTPSPGPSTFRIGLSMDHLMSPGHQRQHLCTKVGHSWPHSCHEPPWTTSPVLQRFISLRCSAFACQHLRRSLSVEIFIYIYFFFVIFLSVVILALEIIGNMFCRLCWIDFNAGEAMVECAGPCGSCFHRNCVDCVTGDVAHILATGGGYYSGLEWYCRTCRQLYRLQVYFEVAISEERFQLTDLLVLGFTANSRLAARKLSFLIEFVACV